MDMCHCMDLEFPGLFGLKLLLLGVLKISWWLSVGILRWRCILFDLQGLSYPNFSFAVGVLHSFSFPSFLSFFLRPSLLILIDNHSGLISAGTGDFRVTGPIGELGRNNPLEDNSKARKRDVYGYVGHILGVKPWVLEPDMHIWGLPRCLGMYIAYHWATQGLDDGYGFVNSSIYEWGSMGKHFLVEIGINTNSVAQKIARTCAHLDPLNE